jgi:hypothetical protein
MKTVLLVKLAFMPLLAFWVAVPLLSPDASLARAVVAWSQIATGAAMAASVALGRPWTAAFSALEWAAGEFRAMFLRINSIMSALWAAIFLGLGVARFFTLPAISYWAPIVAGTVLSIVLPRLLVGWARVQRVA